MSSELTYVEVSTSNDLRIIKVTIIAAWSHRIRCCQDISLGESSKVWLWVLQPDCKGNNTKVATK